MDHKTGCLICNHELVYLNNAEALQCYYCHDTYTINVKCDNGHYVCDKCHRLPANDLIETYCINSKLEDPLELAITLMKNPKIKMHGPEHHFLVPAVLLSCYYNITKSDEDKPIKIKQARERAEKISGGFCGSHGNCGAGVGTGIFISLITNATPLSKYECKLSNLMTSKSLFSIADYGGPRCCKRNSFLAINEATNFMNEIFGIKFKTNKDIKCEFYPLNKECRKNDCPFYEKGTHFSYKILSDLNSTS